MSVPFTTIVQSLEKGNVNDLASESLATVVERVKATGKKSTIIVELTVEAAGVEKGAKDQIIDKVWISASVKTKLAAMPKQSTLLFIKEDSNDLSKDAPQTSIHGIRQTA
jgi:hypothetical protein